MVTNAKTIIQRATACRDMVYWYGGKRQLATKELADILKANNPSVWTNSYYDTALKDVVDGKTVCDCSGLVCYAYNMPDIGTYMMPVCNKLTAFDKTDTYIPGMIAWKPGHCGIILDSSGHIAEMRSIKWDYSCRRTFKEAGFKRIYYAPSISYEIDDHSYGWHEDATGWWFATGVNPGEYYRNCFAKINNRWFHFNDKGYIDIGVFSVGGYMYASTKYGIIAGLNDTPISAKSNADIKGCHLTYVQ